MRALQAISLIGALLVIAGCGLIPSAPPDWVTNRRELPPCGSETLDQGGSPDVEARECLIDAWREGRAAELLTEMRTIEGDPVSRLTRVLEDGRVEVFIDSTMDRFGSGKWDRMVCIGLRPVRADDGLSEEWVFVEEGCGDPEPDL
jgi:hypothetical protein